MTTTQLDSWTKDFGDAYTARNDVDWRDRVAAFAHIVDGLDIGSVLEIGCNRGHNLQAVNQVLPAANVVGVEPNATARGLAERAGCEAIAGTAYDIPVRDGEFDLVFTAGVLIHVALDDLPRALDEIHRTAGKYVLAIEYFAPGETPIPYRGRDDLLWKRDFGGHYRARFDDLELIRDGYLDEDSGFDRCHWWLFAKTGSGA